MIKMRDIQSIEADFDDFKIFLLNQNGTSVGSIVCSDRSALLNRLQEITKHFEYAINGSNITVMISEPKKVNNPKSNMICDSLFMDYSSTA